MLKLGYKLSSPLVAYADVIASAPCLSDHEKRDLIELCRAYGELLDNPKEMAAVHLSIIRDVEAAAAQAQYLRDEASIDCDRTYGVEYANARYVRQQEPGGRITEELLKSDVSMSHNYVAARKRLADRDRISFILSGLKKNLYSRAEMIKVMAVKDRDEMFG